ncbi:MAG: HAD family phosphatase [Rhodobiaceae bacterium]|nr:HAD family phosphatase [Rhodobiaceae bacterium]MCC0060283.1 HAD family phosphatase [Rhodobiaceae bacterium]
MPLKPAIVFDVGNVLVDWQPDRVYRETIPDPEERAWFMAHVVSPEWHARQDLGRSCAEGIAERVAQFPHYAGRIADFYDSWLETLDGAIDGSVRILMDLKEQGYRVHAITNFSAELWPVTVAAYPFLSEFDVTVVSGEEGLLKPDPEIYRRLLKRTGLQATDCIFIDDRKDNVDAASELGFRTIHFTTPETLRMDLIRLGVRLPLQLAG